MDVRSTAPSKRRKISTTSQMGHVQRTVRTEESRELLEPSEDDGTQSFDEEGDVGVLRTWRTMCPELQDRWPEDEQPEDWEGVTMESGRVVKLVLQEFGLTGAVPAEIGRLSALRTLDLDYSSLTSLPAEIGQLTSLKVLNLRGNLLTSLPAEIGQITSLRTLDLTDNQLTSVPAEIGQLTSLTELYLCNNQLTSMPAEIGQLTDLEELGISHNQLTSLPAEIGQLTSLRELYLNHNQLTSVPAEIGQLTSLKVLYLTRNQLMTLPARIRELRAAGCEVYMDDGTDRNDEGDVGVLRTWRAMCPALQDRWPEDEQPEDWKGVTIENGRVKTAGW